MLRKRPRGLGLEATHELVLTELVLWTARAGRRENLYKGAEGAVTGTQKVSWTLSRAGKGVGVRSGEACGPCARILADGQWSAFGAYKATSTYVCALESYLAVMWKWSRKRLLAAGQCTTWHAKLVGAMCENPTSSFGFFRKQN